MRLLAIREFMRRIPSRLLAGFHGLPLRRKVVLYAGLALVAIYQVAFSPPVVRAVILAVLPRDASLQLNVVRSSLLFGFEFDDVRLDDRVSGDPILHVDRLVLKWFLPGSVGGQLGVRELGLYHPVMTMVKRNGRWNTAALSNGEEKKEKPPSKPLDSIELFLPVRLYGALHIEGLEFVMEDTTPAEASRMQVADVDLHFGLITKTFHRIPMDLAALDLIDSLVVALNPSRPFRFEYVRLDRMGGRPLMMLKLYREVVAGDTAFVSRLRMETRDLSLQSPGGLVLPFDMALRYDVFYDPREERVVVRDMRLVCGPDVWLSLSGFVRRDGEGYHHVDLKVSESKILLDRIAPLASRLTGGRLLLGGGLSLYPLVVKGRLDQLMVQMGLNASSLLVAMPAARHLVGQARLDASATVDLYSIGVFPAPPAYRTDTSLAYGIVREAKINALDLSYNGSVLHTHGSLDPGRGIDLSLVLSGFDIAQFTAPGMTGLAGANLTVHSGTDFRRMVVQGLMTLDGMRYRMERSLSGAHNLRMDTDMDVAFPGKGMTVLLRSARLNAHDATGQRLATIALSGNYTLADGQNMGFDVQTVDVDYAKLHPLLPGGLRNTMLSSKSYLEGGVLLSGHTDMSFHDGQSTYAARVNLILPAVSKDGLQIGCDVRLGPAGIDVQQFQVAGLRGALNATVTGSLMRSATGMTPNLDVRLNLSRQGMLPVHESVSLDGSLDLAASVRPTHIDGSIDVRKLHVIYSMPACSRGEAGCTRYHVEDLNLALPFHHEMHPAPVRYETMLNPDLIERFPDRPNLTLRSVWANRSPDGLAVNSGFYYLGAPSPAARPALESNLRYRLNILESRQFRLSTYRLLKEGEAADRQAVVLGAQKDGYVSNGTVDIRNLYFNVADGKPENMQYGAHLSVHDLNVEPYFPKADSSYDGIVSATSQVRGDNLSDPLRNMNARLAVYRISKDFTGLAVRIMVPSDILARLVNNTLAIPSLSAELRGGLVYTVIQVSSPGVVSFSRLIRPREETIRQERIPLAEFLARTRKEAGEF